MSAWMANFIGGVQLTCVCSSCMVIVFMSKISPHGSHLPHSVIPLCPCIFLGNDISSHTPWSSEGNCQQCFVLFSVFGKNNKLLYELMQTPFGEKQFVLQFSKVFESCVTFPVGMGVSVWMVQCAVNVNDSSSSFLLW